ncbi:hypothetical protein [Streptomyces sp. AB3(2024)]|uniref:hypothetical protein n=1 Tax=Streptomyces sp. AB3(2024) TaxID=3317321 RepID=UPI0035A37819
MVPVHLTLMPTGATKPTRGHAHTVVDMLWAHATSECALEHICARPNQAGIGVVLFIRATGADTAQAKARRLMADVLAVGGTGIDGYSVTLHR